jgi:mannosyl-3-phosphoglycerate phosphatase
VLPANIVIFTDLDGTLLDHRTYSWAAAEEALAEIERRRIPWVIVTSKTRAEVELLRRKLEHGHPFVTENGGGVFIPHGYFPQRLEGVTSTGRYHCLSFGKPYEQVADQAAELADEARVEIVGFRQMSAREVAENTGLSMKEAELARQREFDEPFFFAGATDAAIEKFSELARERGLGLTRGGRFWHAFAGSDKGRAVRWLMKEFRAALRTRLRAVALGDSANDLPMLAAVDLAILVQKPGGEYDEEVLAKCPRVKRANASGPEGWNAAVLELLARD